MTNIKLIENKEFKKLKDCEPGFYIRDDGRIIYHVVHLDNKRYFSCIFVDNYTNDKLYELSNNVIVDVSPISIDEIICTKR